MAFQTELLRPYLIRPIKDPSVEKENVFSWRKER
jgi:hypothetical protein